MLGLKSTLLGNARLRNLVAILAFALLLGGSITEASAHGRHRHHHHRHHHHHHAHRYHAHHHAHHASAHWRDANASIGAGSGHSFAGMASFYGNESGSKTASGQRFNQSAMTCAHRSLPFGTRLRVSLGGRSVVVTVNDRGPFIRGRVLDLSTGAARAIGLTGRGVGHVVAEVVS
jgi:rare lipoprotein A